MLSNLTVFHLQFIILWWWLTKFSLFSFPLAGFFNPTCIGWLLLIVLIPGVLGHTLMFASQFFLFVVVPFVLCVLALHR
jgi:hypothetical protein